MNALLVELEQPQLLEVLGNVCGGCGQPCRLRYCDKKCRSKFNNRRNTQALAERAKMLPLADFLPKKKLTERERSIVDMYAEGWGFAAIANRIGVNKGYTRKVLILAGVYRPKPGQKHNGTAKKGTGKYSLVLREKRKAISAKIFRHKIAQCLMGLRKGVGIQRTCRDKGWPWQSVYNRLQGRKSYINFHKSHPSFEDQLGKRRKAKVRSSIYADEYAFHEAIKARLVGANISFQVEYGIGETRTRADFLVGNFAIECKIDTNSGDAQRAIGQAVIYRSFGFSPIILVPDDVEVLGWVNRIFVELGIVICAESGLMAAMAGAASTITTRTYKDKAKGRHGKCRCCQQEGVELARNSNGRASSVCLSCKPKTKDMIFDSLQDRWRYPNAAA